MGFFDGFGLGGLLDFGTSILNTVQQNRQFNYQRDLNNLVMQREDTAVQRRMADLAAAGLNPLMAAQGTAPTSSLSSAVAPQLQTGIFSEGENRGIKKEQQRKDFEFMDNQIDKMSEEVQNIKAQNDVIQQQQEKYKLENEILRGQLKQYEESGFYPTSSFGKLYFDILNAGRAFPQVFPFPLKSLGTGPTDEENDFINTVKTVVPDEVGKLANNLQVVLEGKSNGQTNKTQKNLANTLSKAFGDIGFVVNYYNGAFHIDDFSKKPPEHVSFETYQQAKAYIDARR